MVWLAIGAAIGFACLAGLLMWAMLRKLYDYHLTADEKVPLLLTPTIIFFLTLLILYVGSETLLAGIIFYIALMMAGLTGIAISNAVAGGGYRLFGGLHRSNIGMALVGAGILHILILAILLPALSVFDVKWFKTMLPTTLMTSLDLKEFLAVVIVLITEFLYQFFIVALPEELFFRGYLVSALSRFAQYYLVLPIAMGAWIFAHAITRIPAGAAVALIPIGIGGLVLTYLYSVTCNLLTSVMCHASYNMGISVMVALADDPLTAFAAYIFYAMAELLLGGALLWTREPEILA